VVLPISEILFEIVIAGQRGRPEVSRPDDKLREAIQGAGLLRRFALRNDAMKFILL
jgi:hypothetical protein